MNASACIQRAVLVFTCRASYIFGMHDTSDTATALVRDALLRQTPLERMRATLALSESMRAVSLAGLRVRYPERSAFELVELLTGESLRPAVRHGPHMDGTA